MLELGNYAHGHGRVVELDREHAHVAIYNNSLLVRNHHADPRKALLPGKKVLVAWRGPWRAYRDFDRYVRAVNLLGIEPVDRWSRTSAYQPMFRHSHHTGFVMEDLLVDKLSHAGYVVDESTLFEDEKLGVDLWLYLKDGLRWDWYPIDFTINPYESRYSPYRGRARKPCKFIRNLRRGVITVYLKESKVCLHCHSVANRFMKAFMDSYKLFIRMGGRLLPRERALGMEEGYRT